MASDPDLRWVFDELPPSGARRGGDPSEHAFKGDLESFVREVIQNANDQAVARPRVELRLRELEGEALEDYLAALGWDTLEPHLEGAAVARGGSRLRDFLDGFRERRRLLILEVEDRGTRGLTGAESEGESHFRALCKDTLYSHKTTDSAGGSYGLGKSVLWTFSGLSTVLFCSELLEHLPGQVSPRLIGRTELPSHAVQRSRWYTGSGWFGQRVKVAHGTRAESLWGERAREVASALHVGRDPNQIGTTIQIVGFRDPTGDVDDAAPQLGAQMAAASARFFWPAMMMSRRELRVTARVNDDAPQHVDPRHYDEVAPFVRCYERRRDASSALDVPGDIAVRTIAVEVPGRRDGAPPIVGHVDLVVRLATERERAHPLLNHVAMFRGPGMVVQYWDRRGLTIGMRGFHAILVAGEARDPASPSAEDVEVEHFLRAAEPPGHDEWRKTPTLSSTYKRGWLKTLERLHRRVSEELKLLLAPRLTQGVKGPDRLQRRFPIGARGGAGSAPSAFRFSGLTASFDGARWHFAGTLEPVERGWPWHAAIELCELGEDGEPIERVAIEAVRLEDHGHGALSLDEGVARVEASEEVAALRFRGTSVSLAGRAEPPSELSFAVTGRLEARA